LNPHGGNFWNFFHILSNYFTTRSYGYMCPKMFFFKNLILALEMAVLERFWWKHSQGTQGVKQEFVVIGFREWSQVGLVTLMVAFLKCEPCDSYNGSNLQHAILIPLWQIFHFQTKSMCRQQHSEMHKNTDSHEPKEARYRQLDNWS